LTAVFPQGAVFLVGWIAPSHRSHPALLILTGFNQLSGLVLFLAFISRRHNRALCRQEDLGLSRLVMTVSSPLQSQSNKGKVGESELVMVKQFVGQPNTVTRPCQGCKTFTDLTSFGAKSGC
jgi:hypothetical protein